MRESQWFLLAVAITVGLVFAGFLGYNAGMSEGREDTLEVVCVQDVVREWIPECRRVSP